VKISDCISHHDSGLDQELILTSVYYDELAVSAKRFHCCIKDGL